MKIKARLHSAPNRAHRRPEREELVVLAGHVHLICRRQVVGVVVSRKRDGICLVGLACFARKWVCVLGFRTEGRILLGRDIIWQRQHGMMVLGE